MPSIDIINLTSKPPQTHAALASARLLSINLNPPMQVLD